MGQNPVSAGEVQVHAIDLRSDGVDKEMYSYLCPIKKKFGIEDTGCCPPKVSHAVDLAAYLERSKFTAKVQEKEGFRRVLP